MKSESSDIKTKSNDDHQKEEYNIIIEPIQESSTSRSSASSISSVDTQDALNEMLGFSFSSCKIDFDTIPSSCSENNNEDDEIERIEIERVTLPKNCYRNEKIKNKSNKGIQAQSHHPETIHSPFCTLLHNVLTKEECEFIIQRGSSKYTSKGYHYVKEAAISTSNNTNNIMTVPLLNPHPHKLSLFQDESISEKMLWKRLKPFLWREYSKGNLPPYHNNIVEPVGLNQRLRVLKYDAKDNDLFSPHYDATTEDKHNNTTSLITVLLYLNEGFCGGETVFHNRAQQIDSSTSSSTPIVPKQGSILLFDHDLYHSGAPLLIDDDNDDDDDDGKVEGGTKYILRTDVMFPNDCLFTPQTMTTLNNNKDTEEKNNESFDDDDTKTQTKNSISTIEHLITKHNIDSTTSTEMIHPPGKTLTLTKDNINELIDLQMYHDMTIDTFSHIPNTQMKHILSDSTSMTKENIESFMSLVAYYHKLSGDDSI